ncbi:MAG: hypothetical protein MRJ96_06185 [Nitrospirales bacterium]|nr:hypothetical protein [Nitrospirales bacterium]
MLQKSSRYAMVIVGLLMGSLIAHLQPAIAAGNSHVNETVLFDTVKAYAESVSTGNSVAAGQGDFVCLLRMKQESKLSDGSFPPDTDQIYDWCTKRRDEAHARAIQQRDRALDAVWPGKGQLVDFADFQRFYIAETGSRQLAPSFFVMKQIAVLQPEDPYTIEKLRVGPIPHASFKVQEDGPVVAAPTNLVTVKINYPNPMTAPVSNASGSKDWAVPYKKPQGIVKSVKVKWVVLSDLKQFGFPVDHAVLDIPLEGPHGTTIPFVIEAGGFVQHSTEWWGPGDATSSLQEGLERAKSASDDYVSLMLLNRILLVDPRYQDALQVFADHLFVGLLKYGERIHGVHLEQKPLAQRFNELYWTVQAQTDRMDLTLPMEMGGKSEPQAADYLYRMIPVMEMLSSLQPGDFENRRRLGLAYQWINDQRAAISSPQELLSEVPSDQHELRARLLLELAWSRIGKVAWTRHLDDPDLPKGYEEAKTALGMMEDPLDKFTATYAMAYSLAFRVPLDKQAMLELLKQSRGWFEQVPGATPEAWAYMLNNDTLKGFVNTDPSFQALVAAK